MPLPKIEDLKNQLADMQAKRDSFMQSYWQADGACQTLASLIRIAEAPAPKQDAQPEPNPNL
jgi:hypothetical protein